ncbi:class I SAM-dependent methyltransferase [Lysobacter sp. CFH 32150]|uniref:class I SAM-dependent methyltransferase n=1 Tax=Lysobacter sp. CFH 32150 TaxID=2927128 RepID=UPI001FA7AD96|nr:class I SAM-dependent methyltransferase [Lysobacter sp. CFH 32150]MCI4567256.1 class I SAM-dependent methyltransferase [Lysobacter sp. CFH 32150]
MGEDNIKYRFKVDLDDPNNGHSLLHALVIGTGKSAMEILEVGCSSGYVGATFMAKGHRVTGVEQDPASAAAAGEVLGEVHNGAVDDFFDAHPDCCYDAILLGDVLEHIADPTTTLRRCVTRLAPDGVVAISLPCITHGSVRAMLLEGRWDYGDYGLLDRTHLRFFSREGMAQLLADAGLEIEKLFAVVLGIDDANREYGMKLQPESIAAVEALANDDEFFNFQFVLLARPSRSAIAPADLLARNLAMPIQKTVPTPRLPGCRSSLQRQRIRWFKSLLQGITRRRFRNART